MLGMTVQPIKATSCRRLLIDVHYAGRIPSISYAFGLLDGEKVVGCCTFGTPAAAPARTGLMGPEMAHLVLELNRLVLDNNTPHLASWFVAQCLKRLPKPRLIVSFADTKQGHVGTVYQALNFLYTGLSAKRTDWHVDGLDGLHGQTVVDRFRGSANRAQAVRDTYGDKFKLVPRSRKHRYVLPIGSRKDRKRMTGALRYPLLPYPKAVAHA